MTVEDLKLDFIGVGVSRSGTTWIYECLKEHPQICMSKKEEAAFFDCLKPGEGGIELFAKRYAANFIHCQENQIRGEYTPGYLNDPEILPLIKKHYPEAKLIVLLRNPVERFYSQYLSHKQTGTKEGKKTLEEIIKEGRENLLIKFGFYYSQLKNVFELFPKNNVLVLITEDIAKDPVKFIQGVYKFLGADPSFVPSIVNERIHPLARNPVKSVLLDKTITKTLYFAERKPLKPIKALFRKMKVNELINFISRVNYTKEKSLKPYKKPPLPTDIRKALQEIYRPEIEKLEKLINRDLNLWNLNSI